MKRTSLLMSMSGIIVLLCAVDGSTSPPELPVAGEVEPTPEVEFYVADGGTDPLGEIHIRCKNPTAEHVLITFSSFLDDERQYGTLSFRPTPGTTARVLPVKKPIQYDDIVGRTGIGFFIAARSAFEWRTHFPVSRFFDTRDADPGVQRFVYTIQFRYLMEMAAPNGRAGGATSTGMIEFRTPVK